MAASLDNRLSDLCFLDDFMKEDLGVDLSLNSEHVSACSDAVWPNDLAKMADFNNDILSVSVDSHELCDTTEEIDVEKVDHEPQKNLSVETETPEPSPKVTVIKLGNGADSDLVKYLTERQSKRPVEVTFAEKSRSKFTSKAHYFGTLPVYTKPKTQSCSSFSDDDSVTDSDACYQKGSGPKQTISSTSEGLSMSKNAINARENRKKKKNYISDLETSVERLSTENETLKCTVSTLAKSVGSLKSEVQYLKSVLANETTLADLLSNIVHTPGVNFISSERCFGRNFPNTKDSEENNNLTRPIGERMTSKKRVCDTEDKEDAFKENVRFNKRVCTQANDDKTKNDHDYSKELPLQKQIKSKNSKREDSMKKATDITGEQCDQSGICLHVSNKTVSVEFCATCCQKAAEATELS